MQNNELANQIAQMQKQMSQLQQMAALGELVGTTTHEFNNYLMTIINYAKLGMRAPDQESRDRAFQKIFDAGQKAAQVTNLVLGAARNRSDQMEAIELGPVIEQAMVLLEREMRKFQIAVELKLNPTPPVLANGNQIQQVLINLLINARQAIGSGGEIHVELSEDKKAGTVDLKVRDSGAGMPPEVLHNIFEPQFSTKQGPDETGKGGSGFGLYNCRQIIEQHAGRIRVDSKVGAGTCFTIKLKAATTKKRSPQKTTGPAEVAAKK